MKKNNNGFTLIELLAIIVILAIIAVITVPLILNVIEDSKKGAAQDSSYGYKDAIEKFTIEQMGKNYNFKLEDKTYTTEELKNLGLKVGGQEPTSGKVKIEKNMIKSFTLQYDKFTCNYPVNNKVECGTGTGLTITNINLESTSNSITVTVSTSEENVTEYLYKIGEEEFISSNSNTYTFNNLEDNKEYEITVKIKNEFEEDTKSAKITTKIEEKPLSVGDEITYGGYNWHVIRIYEEDGTTYQTLLMDAGQLDNMAHCTDDADPNTDCGYDDFAEYLYYSWDKSLIQTYLNTTFINKLQANGENVNKIKSEQVCVERSQGENYDFYYGGYLKEEIEAVSETCSEYDSYKIRLITPSEYYNLSYYYRDVELPHREQFDLGTFGTVAKLNGIERLSESDSGLWLHSESIGKWWSMGSSYGIDAAANIRTYGVFTDGKFDDEYVTDSYGVRPVITIMK